MISLPKEWIKRMALTPGSLLKVTAQNGSLLLRALTTKKVKGRGSAQVWITSKNKENPMLIKRMLGSAYVVGFDEILVKAKGTSMEESLRKDLKGYIQTKLPGVEIMVDSSEELTLKIIAGFEELSLRYSLEKMRDNIISMYKDAVNLLEQVGRVDDKILSSRAEEIKLRDDINDRAHFNGIRLLKAAADFLEIRAEIGLSSGRECLGYRLIIKSMERIGDHAAKICRYIQEILKKENSSSFLRKTIDPQILREIREMSRNSINAFSSAMECFLNYIDYPDKRPEAFFKANDVIDYVDSKVRPYEEVIDRLLFSEVRPGDQPERSKLSSKDLSSLKIIAESIRRAAEYSSDIAEIILNLTISDVIKKQVGES